MNILYILTITFLLTTSLFAQDDDSICPDTFTEAKEFTGVNGSVQPNSQMALEHAQTAVNADIAKQVLEHFSSVEPPECTMPNITSTPPIECVSTKVEEEPVPNSSTEAIYPGSFNTSNMEKVYWTYACMGYMEQLYGRMAGYEECFNLGQKGWHPYYAVIEKKEKWRERRTCTPATYNEDGNIVIITNVQEILDANKIETLNFTTTFESKF